MSPSYLWDRKKSRPAMARCKNCRFWSDQVAQIKGGLVEALCLNNKGRYSGRYTPFGWTCDAWKAATHGAIDEPENLARNPYAEEEIT